MSKIHYLSHLAMFLFCLLTMGIHAQESPTAPLQLAYQDAGGAVLIYHESDGTTTTLIPASDIPRNAQVSAKFSPDGHFVAVLVWQVVDTYLFNPDDEGKTIGEMGYKNTLYVYNLVTGELLLGYDTLPAEFVIKPQERDAMLEADFGVQWSPNSDGLFFVRGTATPVDEYTTNGYGYLVHFNLLTQQLTDLPATGGTPYDWQWSKNGQYAVYRSIDNFGSGAGFSTSGVYVVNMTDITAISQRALIGCCDDIVSHGWLNSGEFVYSYFSILAGAAGLFVYNPQTDSTVALLPQGQNNLDGNAMDIDPTTDAIVVSVYDFPADEAILEAGIYVYENPQDAEPMKIADMMNGRLFFGAPYQVYIGSEAPIIYNIQTNLAVADSAILRYVYGGGHNLYFTEGETGARAYAVNTDGTLSIYDNILPNDLLSSMRYTDAYFIGFIPHHYQGQMGSDVVYVGANDNPSTTRSVSIGAGNFLLDVTIQFND